MRRMKYSTECNQIKVEKTRFEKVNRKNDVIHDAQKVIWDIILKKIGDIGKFGDVGPPVVLTNHDRSKLWPDEHFF